MVLGFLFNIFALIVTGPSIGVGFLKSIFREPVAYQIIGDSPISLFSVLYASAMDEHTQWQSIRVAIVPPFKTSGGIAA